MSTTDSSISWEKAKRQCLLELCTSLQRTLSAAILMLSEPTCEPSLLPEDRQLALSFSKPSEPSSASCDLSISHQNSLVTAPVIRGVLLTLLPRINELLASSRFRSHSTSPSQLYLQDQRLKASLDSLKGLVESLASGLWEESPELESQLSRFKLLCQ